MGSLAQRMGALAPRKGSLAPEEARTGTQKLRKSHVMRETQQAEVCMDHNIFLSKLKRYDIHETALQWNNSYLSDREHFVSWNQTHAPLLNLNIGVPQVSILGPLFFLIYIRDIVNSSNILSFVLFADDTTVCST